jgi:hypothetical protein
MNIKKHIYIQALKKRINEGLIDDYETKELRPDLKYYAFDWDDNLMFMPTKIMVMSENDDEIGMSTEDFAEHRTQIGVEPFKYKSATIIGFANEPFRFFREMGDKRFVVDSMTAPLGPAWNDFVECINGGSIFAIITARGHNPETLKESVYNLIMSNKNGLNRKKLEESLRQYDLLTSEGISEDIRPNRNTTIEQYLNMCKFHPVSYGSGSAASPEEGKNKALKGFISYCRDLAKNLIQFILKKNPNMDLTDLVPKFKNDVAMDEPVINVDEFVNRHTTIGFSDDDQRNIEASSEFLNKEYEKNPVNLYLTKGGKKTRFN